MYELASNKITCDSVTIVSFKSAFQPVVAHLRHPLWRNKGSGLTMKNTSSAIVKRLHYTSKTVNHYTSKTVNHYTSMWWVWLWDHSPPHDSIQPMPSDWKFISIVRWIFNICSPDKLNFDFSGNKGLFILESISWSHLPQAHQMSLNLDLILTHEPRFYIFHISPPQSWLKKARSSCGPRRGGDWQRETRIRMGNLRLIIADDTDRWIVLWGFQISQV